MPHVRSPLRLDASRAALLVIDLQEKLVPAIPSADNVIRQTVRLHRAAELLNIPSAATVQYPQGLGPLVPELREAFPNPEEKLDFSAAVCRRTLDRLIMGEDSGVTDDSANGRRDQIVVTGIETHICVLQTVLDLVSEGLRPVVVAEAVAARHGQDHERAIERMRDAGAMITTVESVMFEWVGTAAHPEFKAISRLVKS